MSQRDDVLRMLEHAGERGVTTGQFIDAKIPRFSARIEELRRTHLIVRHRVTASRYRYELVGEPFDRTAETVESIPGTPHAAGTSFPRNGTVNINQPADLPAAADGQPSGQTLFDTDGEPAVIPAMYRDAA